MKNGSLTNLLQPVVILRLNLSRKSGFEGGMTAKKYVSINKTSKSTATRDLQELADKNIFVRKGGGRSVSYDLNLE